MAKRQTRRKVADDLPDPFSRVACERLRALKRRYNEANTRREQAIADKKNAETELADTPIEDVEARKELKAKVYDADVSRREALESMKAYGDRMAQTIQEADQHELWGDPTYTDPEVDLPEPDSADQGDEDEDDD